ncbi:DNA-processing protein DprA, partial [Microbacteriaceae bacterium 4G12]
KEMSNMTKRERLLHVHICLADNWRAIDRLLRWDPDLEQIYALSPKDFESLLSISSQKSLQLFQYLHTTSISSITKTLADHHIVWITVWDSDYPSLLKEIADPPFILYGKGNMKLLAQFRKIAVVGTRNPSSYGVKSIQSILVNLLREEWVIVSGMARGIDITAHQVAVQNNRGTIAVLGGGLFHIYPKENYRALQAWEHNLLLLTEYPPHYKPQRWYFPKRNRIISGLSKGVVIVEAKEKSGSLITADCALEQNREVFAVPGPIHLETSIGTNRLIQQGAKLVLRAEDIVEEWLHY